MKKEDEESGHPYGKRLERSTEHWLFLCTR